MFQTKKLKQRLVTKLKRKNDCGLDATLRRGQRSPTFFFFVISCIHWMAVQPWQKNAIDWERPLGVDYGIFWSVALLEKFTVTISHHKINLTTITFLLEAVHKRHPHLGEWVVQCEYFADKGGEWVLQMRTFTRFRAKNFGFFKFMVSPNWEGVQPVRTRGSILRDFVRTSFMHGSLCVFFC